jgi:hypothetical protein
MTSYRPNEFQQDFIDSVVSTTQQNIVTDRFNYSIKVIKVPIAVLTNNKIKILFNNINL